MLPHIHVSANCMQNAFPKNRACHTGKKFILQAVRNVQDFCACLRKACGADAPARNFHRLSSSVWARGELAPAGNSPLKRKAIIGEAEPRERGQKQTSYEVNGSSQWLNEVSLAVGAAPGLSPSGSAQAHAGSVRSGWYIPVHALMQSASA